MPGLQIKIDTEGKSKRKYILYFKINPFYGKEYSILGQNVCSPLFKASQTNILPQPEN